MLLRGEGWDEQACCYDELKQGEIDAPRHCVIVVRRQWARPPPTTTAISNGAPHR